MASGMKDVLPQLLAQATLRRRGMEQLERRWANAAGRRMAAHTAVVSLRHGRLTIQADEPGVSFTLSLEKPALLKKLNRAKATPITELVIRAGERRAAA